MAACLRIEKKKQFCVFIILIFMVIDWKKQESKNRFGLNKIFYFDFFLGLSWFILFEINII